MPGLMQRLATNANLARACADLRTWRFLKGREAPDDAPGSATDAPPEPASLVELKLRGLRAPLLVRPRSTDANVVWEVILGREYDTPGPWPYRTIVDLGANVGVFAAYAMARARGQIGRYVGVEPDADSFAVLEKQVHALEMGERACLIRAACSDRDGTVRFDSSLPAYGRRISDEGGTLVECLTVGNILDRAGLRSCDLLKIDVEGAERQILADIAGWSPRVRAIVCELHDGLTYEWFAERVRAHGYTPSPAGSLFRSLPSAVRGA